MTYTQARSLGGGLHPVGPLSIANYAVNPAMGIPNKSASFSSSLVSVRTNLLPNPSFEVDLTNWSAVSSATLARDLVSFIVGAASLRCATTSIGQGASSSTITATASTSYTGSVYVKGTGSVAVSLLVEPEATVFASQTVTLTSSWQRVAVTGSTTADATGIFLRLEQLTTGSQTFWADAAMIEQSASVEDYFDGAYDLTVGRRNYSAAGYLPGTWTTSGTPAPTLTTDTSKYIFDKKSLLINWATTTSGSPSVSQTFSTTIGQVYTVSAFVYVPSGNAPVNLTIDAHTGQQSTVYDDWQQLFYTFIATASSHTMKIVEAQLTAGQVYVNGVMIEATPGPRSFFNSALPPFNSLGITHGVDPNSHSVQYIPNATLAWTGTANASSSTRTVWGVTDWTGTNCDLFRSTEASSSGFFCCKMVSTSISVLPIMQQTFTNQAGDVGTPTSALAVPILDSTTYSVSFQAALPASTTGGGISVQFDCYDITNTLISSTVIPLLESGAATNGFIRLATSFTLPPGTISVTVGIRPPNQPTNLGEVFYIDAFMFEQASTPSEDYIDGDCAGYCWYSPPGYDNPITLQSDLSDSLKIFATFAYPGPQAVPPAGSVPMGAQGQVLPTSWPAVPLTD